MRKIFLILLLIGLLLTPVIAFPAYLDTIEVMGTGTITDSVLMYNPFDERLYFFYDEGNPIKVIVSENSGETWSASTTLITAGNSEYKMENAIALDESTGVFYYCFAPSANLSVYEISGNYDDGWAISTVYTNGFSKNIGTGQPDCAAEIHGGTAYYAFLDEYSADIEGFVVTDKINVYTYDFGATGGHYIDLKSSGGKLWAYTNDAASTQGLYYLEGDPLVILHDELYGSSLTYPELLFKSGTARVIASSGSNLFQRYDDGFTIVSNDLGVDDYVPGHIAVIDTTTGKIYVLSYHSAGNLALGEFTSFWSFTNPFISITPNSADFSFDVETIDGNTYAWIMVSNTSDSTYYLYRYETVTSNWIAFRAVDSTTLSLIEEADFYIYDSTDDLWYNDTTLAGYPTYTVFGDFDGHIITAYAEKAGYISDSARVGIITDTETWTLQLIPLGSDANNTLVNFYVYWKEGLSDYHPIQGASIQISENGTPIAYWFTNTIGRSQIYVPNNGTYTARISKTGFLDQIISFTVTTGTHYENVEMLPVGAITVAPTPSSPPVTTMNGTGVDWSIGRNREQRQWEMIGQLYEFGPFLISLFILGIIVEVMKKIGKK